MAISMHKSGDLLYLADDHIPVPHAFTTRLGGVSTGVFSSLNLGVNLGDKPDSVYKNFDVLTVALGTKKERLVFSRQVHGNRVRTVGEKDFLGNVLSPIAHEADALVTAQPNVPLLVFVADCIPILLWDSKTGAVGAVHAGWRSTVQDIVGHAIAKLCALRSDPRNIRAAIGPGIGFCCFETGPDVAGAVCGLLGDSAKSCMGAGQAGKYKIDLKAVNRLLLIRSGVPADQINVATQCTMCMPDLFWSHRATGGVRGSQAAMICAACSTDH